MWAFKTQTIIDIMDMCLMSHCKQVSNPSISQLDSQRSQVYNTKCTHYSISLLNMSQHFIKFCQNWAAKYSLKSFGQDNNIQVDQNHIRERRKLLYQTIITYTKQETHGPHCLPELQFISITKFKYNYQNICSLVQIMKYSKVSS